MKRAWTATILTVLVAAGLAAQAKPNFAGKWTLVQDANAAGGGLMVAAAMTVSQDEKTIAVTTTGQMGELKTV